LLKQHRLIDKHVAYRRASHRLIASNAHKKRAIVRGNVALNLNLGLTFRCLRIAARCLLI
jgi:hypothetical protein